MNQAVLLPKTCPSYCLCRIFDEEKDNPTEYGRKTGRPKEIQREARTKEASGTAERSPGSDDEGREGQKGRRKRRRPQESVGKGLAEQ